MLTRPNNPASDWFDENGPSTEPVAAPRAADTTAGQNAAARGVPLQQFVDDYRRNFGLQLKQSDPAGWNQLADALKTEGYTNVTLDQRSDGLHKGIMDNGQFVKLADGNDNPIWLPGGDQPNASGNGQVSPAFTPPPAWTDTFTAPTWDQNFQAPTQADFDSDTAYQEQLKRGADALQKSAAARGTVLNPGTLKDLSDWTVGTASAEGDKLYSRKAAEYQQGYNQYLNTVGQKANDYQQRYKQYLDAYGQAAGTFGINYGVATDDINRFLTQQQVAFNQNYSLAQLGLVGANGVTNAGNNYATGASDALTSGANATAAGTVGGANAWNNAIGSAINTGTSLYALNQYGQTRYTPNTEGYQY